MWLQSVIACCVHVRVAVRAALTVGVEDEAALEVERGVAVLVELVALRVATFEVSQPQLVQLPVHREQLLEAAQRTVMTQVRQHTPHCRPGHSEGREGGERPAENGEVKRAARERCTNKAGRRRLPSRTNGNSAWLCWCSNSAASDSRQQRQQRDESGSELRAWLMLVGALLLSFCCCLLATGKS